MTETNATPGGLEVERSPSLAASEWWGGGGRYKRGYLLGNEGGRAQYGIRWKETEHMGTNELRRLHCKEFTITEYRTEPGWTGQQAD